MTKKTFLLYVLRDLIIAMLFMTIAVTVLSESKQFSSPLHAYYVEVAMLIFSLIALVIDLGIKENLLLKSEMTVSSN